MNFDCIFLANQENDQSNLYLMVYEIMNKKYVIVFLRSLLALSFKKHFESCGKNKTKYYYSIIHQKNKYSSSKPQLEDDMIICFNFHFGFVFSKGFDLI